MKQNTSKIEQRAISVIRNIVDNIECATHSLTENDKNISWDGDIKLFKNSNVDDKGNLSSIIRVQIKGRTKKIPPSDKLSYEINKKDLENYLKENGTVYFVVVFNKSGKYKIFYVDLLPYNIRKYLKEPTNKKNEIKVKLKCISDNPYIFEKMLRNFETNKKQQEKISEKVFKQEDISFLSDGKNSKLRFYNWGNKTDSITSLLGKETYIYELDENENVININLVTFSMISEPRNIKLMDKQGNVFYDKIDIVYFLNNKIIDVGKCFKFYLDERKVNIKLNGTLKERIKALKFLEVINNERGFFINGEWQNIEDDIDFIIKFQKEKEIYNKINDFFCKHKINKDIDLDKWEWKDINKFLLWIRAIDDGIPIKVEAFKTSVIGSIKINDICFSIFAERKKNGKIFVKSIWNSDISKKFLFMRGRNLDDSNKFESNNVFNFLNKEAYLADDINYEEMKEYYDNNELKINEENSINMQALEIILAYDKCNKIELLSYADYLLDKIIKIESIKNIAVINKCQIKKRLNTLSTKDMYELMKIKESIDEPFYNISINLILDNFEEAMTEFNSLNENEKNEYKKFPIAKYLEFDIAKP